MTQLARQVLEDALRLAQHDRAELAARLLASLEEDDSDGTQAEIDAAWAAEIEARVRRFERGESTSHPANEVMAQLRAKYARP